jgi:aminotransferase
LDEVLIPNPSYTIYRPIIRFLNGKPVPFNLDREKNFHINSEYLEEKLSKKTKAIILCSPNNPTGTVLNNNDLQILADIANDRDLLVISDEIYNEFIWKGTHKSIASLSGIKDRTVIISSFSKTFAMTGWRLGYLSANRELSKKMLELQGNMVLCPSNFVQKAGIAALTNGFEDVKRMAKEYERRIEFVYKSLNELKGVSCNKPEGAFYIWADISEISDSSISFCNQLLNKQNVVTVSGTYFGSAGEGFIRLALVSPEMILRQAIDRIKNYVETYT